MKYAKYVVVHGAGYWGWGDTPMEAIGNLHNLKGSKKFLNELQMSMFVSDVPFANAWKSVEEVPETHAACGIDSLGSWYWIRCRKINLTGELHGLGDAVIEVPCR